MSKNTIPINELPSNLDEESTIAWRIDPGPYVRQGDIGLDVTRTLRIARMAGFGALIVEQYEGERSEFSVNVGGVGGMNPDGSATAIGSASIIAAKTEKASLEQDGESSYPCCQSPKGIVSVNRNELSSRISDRVRNGMSREEAWTRELDRSLRRGLRSAARGKLASDVSESFYSTVMDAVWVGWVTYESIEMPDSFTVSAGASLYAFLFGLHMSINKRDTGRSQIEHHHWSLFPFGVQPDRCALAGLMSTTQRLVQPLKSKTNE